MKVIRVHETDLSDHNQAVREIFSGRLIVECGLAQFPPGVRAHEEEKHLHKYDEVFIILAGEITIPITAGPAEIARTGDWAVVEANEEHHLTNHTQLPTIAIYLLLQKPAGSE